MPFKDILLHLDTYPDPAPHETVDQAVALCASLGQTVTAVAVHVRIPLRSNRVADVLIGLSELAEDQEKHSLAAARSLLSRFKEKAGGRAGRESALVVRAQPFEMAERVAEMARTRDLCVTPYGPVDGPQRALAEAVIFGSGRPVVIFQPNAGYSPVNLTNVTIAWDGSRSAARAVAGAMPVLAAAGEVRILTVLNEKPSAGKGVADDLVRHLSHHGVTAVVDEVDAEGGRIGDVIRRYLSARPAHLLVMGAFGHSRVREFVLGGATESIIAHPPIPVLLAH